MSRYDPHSVEDQVRALRDAAAMMQASIDEDLEAVASIVAGTDPQDIEVLLVAAISLAVQMAEATPDPTLILRLAVDAEIRRNGLAGR